MTDSDRKVRGVGFGNIFAGKKEITLRNTTGNNRNDEEGAGSRRSIVVEKPEADLSEFERARCTYEYKAEFDDELPLAVGDVVIILDMNLEDDGWWKGKLVSTGRIGVFPNNFVELLSDTGVKAASENAPQSRPETNVTPASHQKKAVEAAPPLPAKPGSRAGAPPVGAKPKSPAKLPDSASLSQSISMHSVSTPFESGAMAKPNSTAQFESEAGKPGVESQHSAPTGIRERLERLNLAATVPTSNPTANAAIPQRGARKNEEKFGVNKTDDNKVRTGSLKKGTEAGLNGDAVASSGSVDDTVTLQSLTKGRPRLPRDARAQPNKSNVPRQTDVFDYTAPPVSASVSTTKPPVENDAKLSMASSVVTESLTASAYHPPVMKLENTRELTPPVFRKEATAPLKESTLASQPPAPKPAPSRDEPKRVEDLIGQLRNEIFTLREENARLDRRMSALERELNDERRARQALAVEIDVLKKH